MGTTNLSYVKKIVYNDEYYSDVSSSLITSLIQTQPFNSVILILATDYMTSIESAPTKFSETGGVTVELGNQGARLKAVIENAKNNFYRPVEIIVKTVSQGTSFTCGTLKAQAKDYDLY